MNKDLQFQHYLVVYLDLLGQKESLRKITALPLDDKEKGNFIAAIKGSFGKVDMIRDSFKTYFTTHDSYPPNTGLVAPEFREEFVAAQKSEAFFYCFSDTIILAVPLMNNDENCTPMNGVNAALVATCGIGLFGLSVRVPVRAGLDVGIAAKINDSEVYGPVLEKAYYLEGKIAEYPRFVVGKGLLEYLLWVWNQPTKTRFGTIAKQTAGLCMNMIVKDRDGKPMLDFLGPAIKATVSSEAIDGQIISMALEFVSSQYKDFSSKGDEKLASRYRKLLDYFESRKAVWGI